MILSAPSRGGAEVCALLAACGARATGAVVPRNAAGQRPPGGRRKDQKKGFGTSHFFFRVSA